MTENTTLGRDVAWEFTLPPEDHAKLVFLLKKLGVSRAEFTGRVLDRAIEDCERQLGLIDEGGRYVPEYASYFIFNRQAASP